MGTMESPEEVRALYHTDTPSSTRSPDMLSLRPQADGWTWLLVLAAVSTTLGSAIPYGYNIGVINTPSPLIISWCNETMVAAGAELEIEQLHLLWSIIVSVFVIGGMVGSLAGSWCADYIGRKGALTVSYILGFLSAVMFFCCKPMDSIGLLLLGRLVIGLASGLTMSVMPMYLLELAPDSIRGALGVLTVFGCCLGLLIGQFIGLDWILGTATTWHYLLSCYVLLILVSALALPILPESPKYLYQIRGNRHLALKELSRLRGCSEEEVAHELEDVAPKGRGVPVGRPWTVFSVITTRRMILPLLLTCALQAGQQCSGINAVFFYSSMIFMSAGMTPTGSQYANLVAGLINFLMSAIMMPVVNYCRRRTLLHISCSLTILALIMLTISITLLDTFSWMPDFAVFCVFFFVMVYGIGLGPVPYFIGSELFDVGPRPPVMALGSAANWTGNLIIGMTFPTLQRFFGQWSFLLFAGSTFLLLLFVHFCLPETFVRPQPARREGTEQAPLAKK